MATLLLVLLVLPSVPPPARAATTPSLATANTFGILAHSFTYANSGTTITGDLGYSTTSGTGSVPSVSGSMNAGNAAYTQAGSDQAAALAELNGESCDHNLPFNVDLATYNSGIYGPGVYCVAGPATIGAGGITLSGSGTYLFRIDSTLITADHSVVTLSGGASACDVFWTTKPGVVVTVLGAYSAFAGTLIEPDHVTVKDHMSWSGRGLVYNGTLTVDEKDSISAPTCSVPSTTGTLHVIKTFYNDYGGTAVPSDANIHVENGAGDVAGSPQPGDVSPGTSYTLSADTYTVSEDAYPGYTAIFSGDCDADGIVELSAGDDKTCTVSNDQDPTTSIPATLHVIKHVINDDTGNEEAWNFSVYVQTLGPSGLSHVSGSPAPGAESPGTSYSLNAGNYVVSEGDATGYVTTISGDCDADGNVSLSAADDKTCTITNDDTPTGSHSGTGTLHVVKVVVNDDGGTSVVSDASIHVVNGAGEVAGSPDAGMSAPGRSYSLAGDTYQVFEDSLSGYAVSFSGDCDSNGEVLLDVGADRTCTVTNDDIAKPSSGFAIINVVKHVVNDNGGTDKAEAFSLHLKGSGSFGLTDVSGSPANGTETGTSYTVSAGTYYVSEDPFTGYAASFGGDCDDGGAITLASGDVKTCTMTNDDTENSTLPTATLHVIKAVVNDEGGTAVASDAMMHVTSGLGDVSGSPQAGAGSPGTSYTLTIGSYNVSENFFSGYTVSVGGDCDVNGDITLAAGDDKTCTITNNDIKGVTHTTITTTKTTTTTTSQPCDVCGKLAYDVYIVNPDLTERHTGTAWVRVTDRGNNVLRYSFEDKTIDPTDSNYDYNDAVVDVDFTDCTHVSFMFVSSDADWKHKIRIEVSIDGVKQSDTLVANDSKAVVGTSKSVDATAGISGGLSCASGTATLSGKILLQVQQHGEAWYVRPETGTRYYMKDGPTAYGMMRTFGLGITDADLANIQSVDTVDELKASQSACLYGSSANATKGKILIQVQQHGEAWYVDVSKCRRIYMKDGDAAYTLMRYLGLGITDADLAKIGIGT